MGVDGPHTPFCVPSINLVEGSTFTENEEKRKNCWDLKADEGQQKIKHK
jgi:hypothetical protein